LNILYSTERVRKIEAIVFGVCIGEKLGLIFFISVGHWSNAMIPWNKRIRNMGDYFRFGMVFIKKGNQTEFFLKKPKSWQTDQFWFGSVRFFKAKTGSNQCGLVFSVLARFFSGFFGFCLFFGFLIIKPKPNRTGRFFQKFNRFFQLFFFSVFSV